MSTVPTTPAKPTIRFALKQIIEADDAGALTQQLIEIGRAALASQASEPEWRGIDSAPEGEPVVVFWLEHDDAGKHPERYEIDYLDDGVWQHHDDNYQHFCAVAPAGSTGPRERAPYTHWKPLGTPQAEASKEGDTK